MNKTLKQVLSVTLMMIGIVMIIIGFRARILPPPLTGVGFILIGLIFLFNKNS